MTEEKYLEAQRLKKEIEKHEAVASKLSRIKLDTTRAETVGQRFVKPFVRLLNKKKDDGKVQAEAVLFGGLSNWGEEIPLTQEFMDFLEGYYKDKVASLKSQLDEL
jgi:hypothetical protein